MCAKLHNGMPAILGPQSWPAWLGEEPVEVAPLKTLLVPYPSDEMTGWPVSPRLGNVKNYDLRLIEPISAAG
jgi:putative SOS response-associated peptidase YedK